MLKLHRESIAPHSPSRKFNIEARSPRWRIHSKCPNQLHLTSAGKQASQASIKHQGFSASALETSETRLSCADNAVPAACGHSQGCWMPRPGCKDAPPLTDWCTSPVCRAVTTPGTKYRSTGCCLYQLGVVWERQRQWKGRRGEEARYQNISSTRVKVSLGGWPELQRGKNRKLAVIKYLSYI